MCCKKVGMEVYGGEGGGGVRRYPSYLQTDILHVFDRS